MGQSLVITSGKGGSGKTTLAVNLGAALAASGRTVARVDLDMGMRALPPDMVMARFDWLYEDQRGAFFT